MIKMLILSLTGQCNFACKYCYASDHPAEMMDVETALAALEIAAADGNPFVLQMSGGEPLLNFPVMQVLIKQVKERRLPAIMQLQTNASLLTSAMVTELKAGQVGVGISLDGRPAENDRQRCLGGGQGSSSLVLHGVDLLAKQDMEIGITCVVTCENADKLGGLVEVAYYLGNVRRIGFDLLRAQGRGCKLTPPTATQVKKGLTEAFLTAQKLGRETGKSMLFSQLERVASLKGKSLCGFSHCHAMNGEAVFVSAKGELYACASLAGNPDFYLGKVKTGVEEDKAQKVAKLIQKSMSFCRACSCFTLCGGACFARWYGAKCGDQGYEAECALKQASIEWYQKNC